MAKCSRDSAPSSTIIGPWNYNAGINDITDDITDDITKDKPWILIQS